MPKKPAEAGKPGLLVAKESFVCHWDGADRHFTAWQTLVREGHPILKGKEHLFEPAQAHYEID